MVSLNSKEINECRINKKCVVTGGWKTQIPIKAELCEGPGRQVPALGINGDPRLSLSLGRASDLAVV